MSTAPPDPHAALDRFADGELSPEEAEAFRGHLAGCGRCRARLHERVQLAGLAADALAAGEAPGATVLRPARWRARAAAAVGVALAASLAVVVAGRMGGGEPDPSLWLADRPARPHEVRLSTPAADRYRPYDTARGPEAAPAPALADLAKLEGRGRLVAIADAYLARGAPEAARPYLDRAGSTAESLASRAAMEVMLGQPVEALHHARQALAAKPELRPARWNLALALRAMGLPLGAAKALDAVAAAGEPGWSAEAKQLASQLRADVQRRQEAWARAKDACREAVAGERPFPADLPGAPGPFLRECFDDALARAGTAEAVKRLAPAAAALDARLGGDGARRAVERALGPRLSERAPLSREYAALVGQADPEQREAGFAALADRAHKAGQVDLEIRALREAPSLPAERLQRLFAATQDPWYGGIAGERAAAQDRGPTARSLLESRERACRELDRYELRCLAAERLLLSLYALSGDREAALRLGRAALDRARREGDADAEVALLGTVADAAAQADPDLAAAYDAERALRAGLTP